MLGIGPYGEWVHWPCGVGAPIDPCGVGALIDPCGVGALIDPCGVRGGRGNEGQSEIPRFVSQSRNSAKRW